MKFQLLTSFAVLTSSFVTTLVTATPLDKRAPTVSYFSGFNIGARRPDGNCKSQNDWEAEFRKIKTWSTGAKDKFDTVKLFSTADCDTLARAVPAAINTNTMLWVGLWPVNQATFDTEKGALEAVLKKYGSKKWLKGINVASEALYRKELDPNFLAQCIWDVKGMVQIAYKASNVPVGTADTWTSWVDGRNKLVIKACDVIVMNAFPYWQGAAVDAALGTFQRAITDTINAVGPTKPLVIGETGWPSAGPNFHAAPACKTCLQKYYSATACWLQKIGTHGWFWFSAFDEPQRESVIERNFGIASSSQTPKVNFHC